MDQELQTLLGGPDFVQNLLSGFIRTGLGGKDPKFRAHHCLLQGKTRP